MSPLAAHVSAHRLEGSLTDVSLTRLLDVCRQLHVTGTMRLTSTAGRGMIELRAGVVNKARFGLLTGDAALTRLRELPDGQYRVVQELPDLDGELGTGAHAWGELADVPLNRVMRHCEEHALTCTITMIHGPDLGEIEYRLGDLYEVRRNGAPCEDAIVDMMSWRSGRFRMSAQPFGAVAGDAVLTAAPTHAFRAAETRSRVARGTPPPEQRRALTDQLGGIGSATAYFVRPRGSRARDVHARVGNGTPREPVPAVTGASAPSAPTPVAARQPTSPELWADEPERGAQRPPSLDELFGDGRVATPIFEQAAAEAEIEVWPGGEFSAAPPPRKLTSLPEELTGASRAVGGAAVFALVALASFVAVWAYLQLAS